MSRRNYAVKLDTARVKRNADLLFYISDMQSDRFTIKVTEKGQVLDLSNHVCAMIGISPSNKVAVQYITEQESNILTIVLQRHMMNEVGQWKGRIVIFNEEQTLVLDTFGYIVQQDELAQIDTNIQDDDRTPILTDLINQCRAIIEEEATRVITEQSRVNAEIQRVNREQARVEAEQQRANEYREIIIDLSGMEQEFDDFILQCQNSIDEAINRLNSTDEQVKTNEQERQQAENIRQSNEEERIKNELNRQQVEAERVLAEQERSNNYAAMIEAEEERVQAETNRVNEEAKRRTTEQTRVSAENTRVNNENTREASEVTRKNNENQRVEAETQRQSRYNSFITDAEANANEFENYTNTAKANEEERKANELDRKSQEDRRVSNEVERISNENTRKASEITREKNETSRQNTFSNKVSEVDKKIVEINATKDNLISSVTTKVDNKVSEIDEAKNDMTATISDKVNEVETRFNALTTQQQQDAEVIDARTDFKGVVFDSLKERIDYTDKLLRDSTVSTVETESDFTTVEATSNGYFEDVKLEGKTLVNLCPKPNAYAGNGDIENRVVISGNVVELSLKEGYYTGVNFTSNSSLMKPNTTYTIVANILENTMTKGNLAIIEGNPNTSFTGVNIPLGYKGVFVIKATTRSSYILPRIQSMTTTTCKTGEKVKFSLMVFEGDHTQNPPSGYIEGLKSVSQDVDEIVVSSVNGDGNLVEYMELNGVIIADGKDYTDGKYVRTNYITVEPNQTYYIKPSTNVLYERHVVYFYDSNKSYLGYKNGLTSEFTTVANTKFIRLDMKKADGSTNTQEDIDNCDFVVSKCRVSKYIPYQSDKKRLLYYNDETQTWEKPILREWDSIEKHADGKYYYHVRSIEEEYTEGDETVTDYITDMTKTVKKISSEKVYECTNIDLITYANETNYIVECGAIVPKTTLKVLQNAANIIRQLQQKVSILEQNESKFMQILIDLINK